MKRKVLWMWLVAMLLAVVVALWPAESECSTEPVWLVVVVDEGTEEHPPRLATTLKALEGTGLPPRGALLEVGGQSVEPIQRRRVRAGRRTARGPPPRSSPAMGVNEVPIRKEKRC